MNDVRRKFGEPSLGRLTKTVKRFVEAADDLRAFWVREADGLLTQHIFIEMPVEKGIGDIQLMSWPLFRHGNGEHSAHDGRFNNRCEGFLKVNPGALSETAHNPPCLVSI
jgi:hypothetical protein